MMQPICASASPTSFLYSRFFFRFGVFQQWVFLSRREGFEQLFLYLFRASSFLALIFCDGVLRASLYLVPYALYQWKNEERDLCMSHSLDARLHLILVASKRSARLDAGSLFLTTPDRVIVSYKIEWRAFLFVDIYFYFFCHTWFSLSSIVLFRQYLSPFNTA